MKLFNVRLAPLVAATEKGIEFIHESTDHEVRADSIKYIHANEQTMLHLITHAGVIKFSAPISMVIWCLVVDGDGEVVPLSTCHLKVVAPEVPEDEPA